MNETKLFLLVLLLVLFMVSTSKKMLIAVTLIITGFFIYKKQYNIALIVLSALFFTSLIYNNHIETFQSKTTSSQIEEPILSTTSGQIEEPILSTTSGQIEEPILSTTSGQIEEPILSTTSGQIEEPILSTTSGPQTTKTSQALQSPQVNEVRLTQKDYAQLFFVLKALLDETYYTVNSTYIDNVIDDYQIKSVFDLSKTVLNKEKNPLYNNFLEKLSCYQSDGSVNYITCDSTNYKKIYAFCELVLVFTLDLNNIIELINRYNVMKLCELSADRSLLDPYNNQTFYGFEVIGLQYYLNEKTFARKYYDILELLELDKYLNNDLGMEHITLREKLYNYNNSNKQAVKDLNSIMVLFDYYSIFDKYVLNLEDDDYNWNLGILKSVDLNLPCWDMVSFFTDYQVKDRIIKTINKLTSVDDEFLNRGTNPENPFADEPMPANSNEGYEEEEDLFKTNLQTFGKRYKKMVDDKKNEQKALEMKLDKKLNLNHVKTNFNKTMIDIIDDLALLMTRKCDLDCSDSTNPLFSKFIFYINEVFKILTKSERMLYVGMLMVVLGIIFNFINASK